MDKPTDVEKSKEFSKDVMKLVDHLSTFKIPRGVKDRLAEKRSKLVIEAQKEKLTEKAEELAKKKAEKQKEKEARIAAMSPEEQRKYEEKERKREKQKQSKKIMKIVKK